MTDLEIQEQAEKIASKRPKLEYLDEFAFDNRGVNQIAYDNYALGFIEGAKWMQEQDKSSTTPQFPADRVESREVFK